MVAQVNPLASADYYLQHEATPYYLNEKLVPGVWYGEAAEELGFVGTVEAEALRNAYAGMSADGQQSLVQQQVDKQRQPGWDVTLSPPKSVSVLWMMLDDSRRQLLVDHLMEAAKSAIDYLDAEALITRRGKHGERREHARGLYALCPHSTSRAQDPQLHIHALCFNLSLREDGTTGALRSHDLYLHKMAAGALFRLELAHRLESMGLTIREDGWKFQIEGVPEQLCEEFSKRRQEILEIAKAEGWTSAAVLSRLAIETRAGKEDVSLAELFPYWRMTAAEFGWTTQDAAKLFKQTENLARETPDHRQAQVEKVKQAIKELSQFEAYFPERDIVEKTAVLSLAMGLSAKEVRDVTKWAVRNFEHQVGRDDSDYTMYSTKENIEAEKELIANAIDGIKSRRHVLGEQVVEDAQQEIETILSKKIGVDVSFTPDQAAALKHITTEPGSFKLVQGYAGTGKTQLLEAAVLAWKSSGLRVVGTSLSGKAALQLETTAKVPSYTVDQLLWSLNPRISFGQRSWRMARKGYYVAKQYYFAVRNPQPWIKNPWKQALRGITTRKPKPPREKPSLDRKTILVVDEAAMLSTQDMLKLQRAANQYGAKIVALGDTLQLPPIEAGGPFAHLGQRLGQAELTTIIRQEHEWMQEALWSIINNRPEEALESYASRGALKIAEHRRAAMDSLVKDWFQEKPEDLREIVALTSTNAEAQKLNGLIQQGRKRRLELGWFSARLPNGQRVHTNDRILFTKNDYQLGVRNGLLGTVEKIRYTGGALRHGTLVVRLDHEQPGGWLTKKKQQRVEINLTKYQDVELGYAMTTHKGQGMTVEKSLVLLGETMLNREMAFTQLSRAKKVNRLYAADAEVSEGIKNLARKMSFSIRKDLAHDHTLSKTVSETQKEGSRHWMRQHRQHVHQSV